MVVEMSSDGWSEPKGQVAIVTGVSSEIGEATASALAARREDEPRTLADQIEWAGGDALSAPTDVTNENDIDAPIEATFVSSVRSMCS